MKILETLFLLVLIGVIMAAGNIVGYHADVIDTLKAMGILVAIAGLSFLIAKLPLLSKLPVIFWVSVVAIVASVPAFPASAWVLATASKIQFLAVCTPILAYAGLAVGKDLEMFKKISWRIILVALAVCAGTFLCAAIIAQSTLHWEGII